MDEGPPVSLLRGPCLCVHREHVCSVVQCALAALCAIGFTGLPGSGSAAAGAGPGVRAVRSGAGERAGRPAGETGGSGQLLTQADEMRGHQTAGQATLIWATGRLSGADTRPRPQKGWVIKGPLFYHQV